MPINLLLCYGSRWSYYHCRSSCRPHHNFKPLYILSWLYTYVNTCRPKNQTWYYSACGFAKGRTRTREVADGEGRGGSQILCISNEQEQDRLPIPTTREGYLFESS